MQFITVLIAHIVVIIVTTNLIFGIFSLLIMGSTADWNSEKLFRFSNLPRGFYALER